ncbi:hypothetical protein [Neobacillus soli]|uniref:hypothetical protein n=1 Tax=Neobacillus soli TaxID=220688 RepID=UPI0008255CC9|nr:hypothetical protein [Neobacillus soli]
MAFDYEDVWDLVFDTLREVNSKISIDEKTLNLKPKEILSKEQEKQFNQIIRMKIRLLYKITIPKSHIYSFIDLFAYVYFLTDFIETRLEA